MAPEPGYSICANSYFMKLMKPKTLTSKNRCQNSRIYVGRGIDDPSLVRFRLHRG